jgi:hypothetical protein
MTQNLFAAANAAAWAQAALSALAILFSTAAAIAVPLHLRRSDRREADRSRLVLRTTRQNIAPDRLQILISYAPEFTHVGMGVRLGLISPKAADLGWGLRRLWPGHGDSMRAGCRHSARLPGRRHAFLKLTQSEADEDGIWTAVLYVEPTDNVPVISAKLKLRVVTDEGVVLLKRRYFVSAVNDG